ncbi:MAG: hypothetical protein EHM21_03160 [Chloroflexi bacterium]|nr:MAG: hypothetical protein EHM21_03160 [Chloroflexota bacterium]
MKTQKRLFMPAMLGLILLAGCTLSAAPPNIPRTGSTTTPGVNATPALPGNVTGTVPDGGSGYPVVTATTGGGAATAYPVATDTPGTAATQPGNPTVDPIGSEEPYDTPVATQVGTTSPGPLSTATTAPAVSSIPLPAQRETIQFPANATSFVVTRDLAQGGTHAYQLQASAGQRMYITTDGNAVLQVYGPNQNALTNVVAAINPVQVPLSQAGTYFIALQGSGPVVMSVYIPAANANQNVAAPVPAQLQPVQFQPGATSTSFSVNTTAGTPLGYTLNVQAGQRMTVTTSGNATITLLAPDKVTLVPSAPMPTHQWQFNLTQSGNYVLIILGNGPVTVNISIPPLSGNNGNNGGVGSATPIPVPGNATRVNFGAGNASAKVNANLVSGTPQAYVLGVNAGQTLYVSTTGSVDVTIYGPGNNVLVNGHASYPNRWSVQANQTGDYTFVISGNGPSQLEFYVPPQ